MERIKYQELPHNFFEPLRQIEEYIHSSNLDTNLLNLIRLRVSQMNACAYCLDMHYKEMKHLGETELRMSMLAAWKDTDVFSEQEKVVLAFAEALTQSATSNIEYTFNALTPYFSKAEIAFLSLTITQINTWNRLMKAFHFKAGLYKVEQ